MTRSFSGVDPPERLEPDELHLDDHEPELLLHGASDRLTSRAAHVQVRRLAVAPVAHGEDVAGRERAEQRNRDSHTEDDREGQVGRVVDAEIDPVERHKREDGHDRELRVPTRTAGHYQHVDESDEDAGEPQHRL